MSAKGLPSIGVVNFRLVGETALSIASANLVLINRGRFLGSVCRL